MCKFNLLERARRAIFGLEKAGWVCVCVLRGRRWEGLAEKRGTLEHQSPRTKKSFLPLCNHTEAKLDIGILSKFKGKS